MRKYAPRRGFTLIELVIVIGLIALIAATVVFVLNPATLFEEGRDIRRIADIGKMNGAMGLLMASGAGPLPGACILETPAAPPSGPTPPATPKGSPPLPPGASPPPFNPPPPVVPGPWCYQHAPQPASCAERYAVTVLATSTASQAIDGTGWVPVDLARAGGITLISSWPTDPREDSAHFYSFICRMAGVSDAVWEFSSHMESARYASGGPDDIESIDGGNRPGLFEAGTDIGL